eukprot:1425603-Ditylum_brightwellii.AAC.1
MRKHYNGWDGFTMYDVLIFWWSIQLYALSKVSMGKELEEMNSVIERIEKNDSNEVYIIDDVTVDKEVSTYQYGEECSEKFKS